MPDTSSNTASGLSRLQLDHLALALTDKREELVSSLLKLNQQIVSREDCSITDAAEAACHREDAARAMGIAEQHRHTIDEIDHALRKLAIGNYGCSETSGKPIDYQRLLLVPWARMEMLYGESNSRGGSSQSPERISCEGK